MSETKTIAIEEAAAEKAAPESPPSDRSDDAKSAVSSEVKDLLSSLKDLSSKRRAFRQVQLRYATIKKSSFKNLQVPQKSDDENDSKSSEKVQHSKASIVHRILRNFNFAINIQVMAREDDKRVFPDKFSKEIEDLFDDKEAFAKLKKALQTNDRDDQLKELPDSLSDETIKAVTNFVESNEQEHIIAPMEKLLKELTDTIDEKKARL